MTTGVEIGNGMVLCHSRFVEGAGGEPGLLIEIREGNGQDWGYVLARVATGGETVLDVWRLPNVHITETAIGIHPSEVEDAERIRTVAGKRFTQQLEFMAMRVRQIRGKA